MYGCNTKCPNCQHEFKCCHSTANQTPCCSNRRAFHVLSGGGLVPTLSSNLSNFPLAQVSPSMPLTFVMPPCSTPLQVTTPPLPKPEIELERLAETVHALQQTGWYYEGISYQQSHELLRDTKVGTFLVRNSSDARFLFSLSVQTERGPTSVRLFYCQGYFRLDAQPHLQTAMPLFPSVLRLIEHYVKQSRYSRESSQVWVDPQGKWYSPIVLTAPLVKSSPLPSLKHLSRLAINRALKSPLNSPPRAPQHEATCSSNCENEKNKLGLPNSLILFMEEYPFVL